MSRLRAGADHILLPTPAKGPPQVMSTDGPKQVDEPNYHHESHTAAQTCDWTANALRVIRI